MLAVETVSSEFIVGIAEVRYLDAELSVSRGDVSVFTDDLLADAEVAGPVSSDALKALP